ncbi:MAG: hypothetical protein GY880_22740 [Planctomycetaceae bacterium]|nr:hypothetical protein [Planctomycetaceae bacterium]
MDKIAKDVLKELNEDLVSHRWIARAITPTGNGSATSSLEIETLLSELSMTGKVEIGLTQKAKPDYLEFVAWMGTVPKQVARAMEAVSNASDSYKEFGFGLYLRENFDHFERDG